jgi:hypothetical protein
VRTGSFSIVYCLIISLLQIHLMEGMGYGMHSIVYVMTTLTKGHVKLLFPPPCPVNSHSLSMISVLLPLHSEIHMSLLEPSSLLSVLGSMDYSMVVLYSQLPLISEYISYLPHSGWFFLVPFALYRRWS